jgi:hypothetical protein
MAKNGIFKAKRSVQCATSQNQFKGSNAMKKLTFLAAILGCFGLYSASANDQPRGSLMEVHSCELYAGGCVVSSEATLGGRYMLRAWNFSGGSFAGTDLAGLQVALLESSSDNLAASKTTADHAIVYLPESATANQRKTLLAWLKSNAPELKSAKLQTRVAPLRLEKSGNGYEFSAGNTVSVSASSSAACDMGSCGEELWYTPRSTTTVFTVVANRSSHVSEPSMKLKWDDAGKRSVFLAKFGETASAKEIYVTAADFCGTEAKLF